MKPGMVHTVTFGESISKPGTTQRLIFEPASCRRSSEEIFSQLARGEDQSQDLADGQRQQWRLVSEIIAERRLPERIAAEGMER
jgi:hypothetical protein